MRLLYGATKALAQIQQKPLSCGSERAVRMDNIQMTNKLKGPCYCRLIAVLLIVLLLLSWACSKKSKTETVSTSPTRILLLPFNVPAANKDLQWMALAAPILMTKTGEYTKDIEIMPIWQTMSIALSNAGNSRSFTPETAAAAASWVAAKWSVMGEITPSKNGVSMVVDFIPAKSTLVPFRYLKSGKPDVVGAGLYDAYSQFLRYLVAKPLQGSREREITMTSMKPVAEALDREYGWFVEAAPGKAQDVVESLMHSSESLARSLFSPTVYPSLAAKK
jgi:hypothetical protein